MPTFNLDPALVGGNFYRTESVPEGHYQVFDQVLGTVDDVVLRPGDVQVNLTPTQLNASDCVIRGKTTGNRVRLRSFPRQAAMQGRLEGAIFDKTVGQATLLLNIAGNLTLVPAAGGSPPKVKVVARYIMDGEVWTSPNNVFGKLNASVDANISIDGLGVANSAANQTGLVGGQIALTPSFSPSGPGVAVGPSVSTQTTAAGVALKNIAAIGELPVGVPITWTLTSTMRAENDKSPITGLGCSAALSLVTHLWVEIALSSASGDPLYSSSVFSFDTGSGLLGVAHPLAVLQPLESSAPILIEADPPTVGPTVFLGDRQSLLPEVEAIVDGDVFSDNDGLLGSIISYSNIAFLQQELDGTLLFTDGQISFLDPADFATVRASADITGIVADPNAGTFGGSISNFQFGSIAAEDSPLGDALAQGGGSIEFDPDIITESEGFTVDATTSTPWSTVVRPS